MATLPSAESRVYATSHTAQRAPHSVMPGGGAAAALRSAARPRSSATAAARRFIDERIAPRSCAYSGSDGSPGFGGRTISPVASWPTVFEHSEIDASFSSCDVI